jgi:hypothetical protein
VTVAPSAGSGSRFAHSAVAVPWSATELPTDYLSVGLNRRTLNENDPPLIDFRIPVPALRERSASRCMHLEVTS